MSNDLISYNGFSKKLAGIAENFCIGIKKALKVFDQVKNFEDIERIFFLDRGLSVENWIRWRHFRFTGGCNNGDVC